MPREYSFHNYKPYKAPNGEMRRVDYCAVDILVPFHKCYDLVGNLIESIILKTKSNPYLITLIDDGSPQDASAEFKKHISSFRRVKYLRLDEPKGFGAAVNFGIQNTELPYVCVLHSDCKIEYVHWLESLGDALVKGKKENIRMVVPRTNNSLGYSTEHDLTFDEFKVFLSQSSKQENQEYSFVLDDPVSSFCFLAHRELFNRTGGLKEYPYAGYELDEFYYRLTKKGFKQAIVLDSWVSHKGSGTLNRLCKGNSKVKKESNLNRDRCLKDISELING